ncbi:MAG: beta-ketoacyl synthase N-terminal-like domain-containing protein [Bilophila wadsworthia]
MLISNMAPGQLAIATGAKGANMVLTSACASGTHAIGAAYTEIVMGRCEPASPAAWKRPSRPWAFPALPR